MLTSMLTSKPAQPLAMASTAGSAARDQQTPGSMPLPGAHRTPRERPGQRSGEGAAKAPTKEGRRDGGGDGRTAFLLQRHSVAKDDRTDEDLMAAYKGGEVGAYRVLVERHHAPVYRFCLRSMRSPEAAADGAQEIFLRVVKNAPSWERKAKFTTWLYTMARNWCIDEARKARFRKTESLNESLSRDGDAGEERLDRVVSEVPQQDRLVDNSRLRKVLDGAIAELPEEQRQVFLLREMSGLQFKDIADLTGVGENTVKSRMRYAMQALQKQLQAAGFVAGDKAVEEEASPRPSATPLGKGDTPTGPPGGARGPPIRSESA